MANLVSPGYKNSALVNTILAPYKVHNIEFKGLNRRSYFDEGEMSDMRGLCSDAYPFLAPRKPMDADFINSSVKKVDEVITRFGHICAIVKKNGDNSNVRRFSWDDTIDTSFSLSVGNEIVAINNYIVLTKDKILIKLSADHTTYTVENIEINFTTGSGTLCNVTISGEYARINFVTHTLQTDPEFKADDVITLSGELSYTDSNNSSQTISGFETTCLIEDVKQQGSNTYFYTSKETFTAYTGEGATNISIEAASGGTASASRSMPDLTHCIEWNNRLWGVNDTDNTIYASKLGDPTNWQYYQGTNMDSYYAQQGTDGVFTGCAQYSNHLIFFKQEIMTKIYGTSPSNYQLSNVICFGVKDGYEKSVTVVNDCVFYYSLRGFVAYQGGLPYPIGEKLCLTDRNGITLNSISCDTDGTKLFAFVYVQDADEYAWTEVYCLDIERAAWFIYHRTGYEVCASFHVNGQLMFFEDDSVHADRYYIIDQNYEATLQEYASDPWWATFGPFTEYIENERIYSKIGVRFKAWTGAHFKIYISENEGAWEQVYEYNPASTQGDFVYIVPRRCDRYSIKLDGAGKIEIQSLTRHIRTGSEV